MNTATKEQQKNLFESGRQRKEASTDSWSVLIPFFIALCLSLSYVAHPEGRRAMFAFDSAHYLQSTQLLHNALAGQTVDIHDLWRCLNLDGPVLPLFGAIALFALRSPESLCLAQAQCLLHALSTALVYLLSLRLCPGQSSNAASSLPARLAQRGACMIPALIFAASPSGLAACGRYLSETITTTLLLGFCYSCVRLQLNAQGSWRRTSVLCGSLACLSALGKSALIPAIAAVSLASFVVQSARKLKELPSRLLFFLLGSAITLSPWLWFNVAATGRLHVLPDRLPGWNIALGSDIETDGWSAIPVPPLLDQNYFDKPLAIIYGIASRHPFEYFALTARKIIRLFGQPWNDFNAEIFPGANLSACVHQIVFLAAIAGMLLAFACAIGRLKIFTAKSPPKTPPGKPDDNDLSSGTSAAIICSIALPGHLIFVPFEAIPRYAYSATPLALLLAFFFFNRISRQKRGQVLLSAACALTALSCCTVPFFTAAGLSYIHSLAAEKFVQGLCIAGVIFASLTAMLPVLKNNKNAATGAIFAAACFLAVIPCMVAAYLLKPALQTEWRCPIASGDRVSRTVFVDLKSRNLQGKPDWIAMLVDGDEKLETAQIEFNGQRLPARCLSILDIPSPYRYQQTLLHTVEEEARAEGALRASLRQWRLFKLPAGSLRDGAWNTLSLTAASQGTIIYGDYDRDGTRLSIPSLDSFALCKLQCGGPARDGRPLTRIGFPEAPCRCRFDRSSHTTISPGDLSSLPGKQTGRYRIFLMIAYKKKAAEQCALDGLTFADRFITLY